MPWQLGLLNGPAAIIVVSVPTMVPTQVKIWNLCLPDCVSGWLSAVKLGYYFFMDLGFSQLCALKPKEQYLNFVIYVSILRFFWVCLQIEHKSDYCTLNLVSEGKWFSVEIFLSVLSLDVHCGLWLQGQAISAGPGTPKATFCPLVQLGMYPWWSQPVMV
jgi:hypothetical protein